MIVVSWSIYKTLLKSFLLSGNKYNELFLRYKLRLDAILAQPFNLSECHADHYRIK